MSDERRISAGTALRTAALLVSFVIELLAAANFVLGMPRASAFYHDIERAGGGVTETVRMMLAVVRRGRGRDIALRQRFLRSFAWPDPLQHTVSLTTPFHRPH